jgi:hypothetical protein
LAETTFPYQCRQLSGFLRIQDKKKKMNGDQKALLVPLIKVQVPISDFLQGSSLISSGLILEHNCATSE